MFFQKSGKNLTIFSWEVFLNYVDLSSGEGFKDFYILLMNFKLHIAMEIKEITSNSRYVIYGHFHFLKMSGKTSDFHLHS